MIFAKHRVLEPRGRLEAKFRRRPRRFQIILPLCMLLAACGQAPEDKQIVSEKRTFITLATGVEIMLQGWLSDILPDQFVSRALPDAGDALGRQAGQISASMVRAKVNEPSLMQAIGAVMSATIAANASVQESNRPAVGAALENLRTAMAQLKAADER